MVEIKKQIYLLFFFIAILLVVLFIYKSERFINIVLPFNGVSRLCTNITEKLCLSEDFGIRLNYYEASTYCSKRGMALPTREDAWEIWIKSENCLRAFSSNEDVPKNKQAFLSQYSNEYPFTPSKNIDNYCSKNSSIKFPIASQYKNGLFWLKDNAGENNHYAINYYNGRLSIREDNTKTLGVRCVKIFK